MFLGPPIYRRHKLNVGTGADHLPCHGLMVNDPSNHLRKRAFSVLSMSTLNSGLAIIIFLAICSIDSPNSLTDSFGFCTQTIETQLNIC